MSHTKGGGADLYYEEVLCNAQPRLVRQIPRVSSPVSQPPCAFTINSQVMQGNHTNSSLTIVDWEGSLKYSFANFSQIKCCQTTRNDSNNQ